jgi:signal transduction histidine kinase/HAMP domain-containing protein
MVNIQQKYFLLLFSNILFPLINFLLIYLILNISLFSISEVFFLLFSITTTSIISTFLIKPFLKHDSKDDVNDKLIYRLPLINTLMVTGLSMMFFIFHIVISKVNTPELILSSVRLFNTFMSMIIFTYFLTYDIILFLREKILIKNNSFPAIVKIRSSGLWKRIAFILVMIFFIPSMSLLISAHIRISAGTEDINRIKNSLVSMNNDLIINVITMSVLLVPLIILFSRSITEPIKRLINSMNKIKEGDFETMVPVMSCDEIGMMSQGLNQMMASLFSYSTLLRQRINRLTLLYNVSQAVNHIEETDKLLGFILDSLLTSMNSEKASVMIIDKDRGKLFVKSYRGNYRGESDYEFSLGEGIAGTVAKTGEIIVANNGHRDLRFLIREHVKKDIEIKNLICAPMIIKDIIVGVVNLCNKQNELGYDNDDIDLLRTVSAQIAGIIERNRLRNIEIEHMKKEKYLYIGRVAAGVAHEIKNPLNAIGMIVQRFKREFKVTEDEEEYITLLEIVISEVSRVNTIVERFLKFARPQELNLSKVELSGLLKEIITLLTPQIEKKGLNIKEDLTAELYCNIDIDKIKQSVINIILNSIEATEKGYIEISSQKKEDKIYIKIKDTGCGISEEDKNKIFELYFTTRPEGSGIGLCIAQKIIEQHKGNIELNSICGKGTEFIIILPIL